MMFIHHSNQNLMGHLFYLLNKLLKNNALADKKMDYRILFL